MSNFNLLKPAVTKPTSSPDDPEKRDVWVHTFAQVESSAFDFSADRY
jgi:hypothetical protein